MPSLLGRLASPGCTKVGSQWDRCGMHWASGHNGDIRGAAQGYDPAREAAMAAFAKRWRRSEG